MMRSKGSWIRVVAVLGVLCCAGSSVQAQLRVTVRDTSGSLLSDEATIRLTSTSTWMSGVAVTAKEVRTNSGEAMIDVGPGEYVVEVEAPGYQRSISHANVQGVLPAELRVYLAPLKKPGDEAAPTSGIVMTPALKKEMDNASSALNEKKLDDAKKHLTKALQIAPSNPDVLYLLGVVEYTEKNTAAARKDFEEVLARYPEHDGSLLMLGQIKMEAGEKREAVLLLEKAAEANPTKWLAHELLAFAYARTGQLDKAFTEAEKTAQLNEETAPSMRLLAAKILLRQQKSAEAQDLLVSIMKEFAESNQAKEARVLLEKMKSGGIGSGAALGDTH
jgi:Flp pilus assembly protein TadD